MLALAIAFFSLPFHQAQGYISSKVLRHHRACKKFSIFWTVSESGKSPYSPSIPLSNYGSVIRIELRKDNHGDLLPRTLYKDIIHL